MKILYVSPFPPARDGIGTYTHAIASGLRLEGVEGRVIAPRAESLGNRDVIGVLGSDEDSLVSLRESVLSWNPDCIHLQFAVAAFGMRTFALLKWLRLMRATQIPVVATLHEVTRDVGLLRGPGRELYRALTARCDYVIVHTQHALEECVSQIHVSPAKISVIPHLTPTPPREDISSDALRVRHQLGDSLLLLAFGFVHVDKGLPDLLRALHIIRESGTVSLDNVRLVVAGSVRRRSGIFRLFEFRDRFQLQQVLLAARRWHMAQHIVLTGYVPEAEIAGWFKAATAVVLPYRRTEQSGVAALANAFGVPVIASTIGGLGELYGGSAWTFPPRSPRIMASVLSEFLATPAEARRATGHLQSDTDLSVVINKTLDVYRMASLNRSVGSPD